MTADKKQIKKIRQLQSMLGHRKDIQYVSVRFKRGGIYPYGVYYGFDHPKRRSDSVSVWLDWSLLYIFLDLTSELQEEGMIEHFSHCLEGEEGDGQYGSNPWHTPGTWLDWFSYHLSDEALELLVDF